MNKRTLLIIIAIIAAILIGCVKNIHSKQATNNLVFWTLQMRDFSSYIEQVIADFETQNPNIKITWVDIPFSEGEKRTLAAILSNNPPDLINLNPDFSTLLAKKGTLTQIPDSQLSQFPEEIITNMKFDGKNYFIPWYATSAITFSNKKLITNTPTNYDDILNLCDATTSPITMFNFAENDSMLKLLNKYGINSSATINTPTAINLYKKLQSAYKSGCFPKESLTQTHRESLEKFMAEEIMIFEGGSNFLNLIKENAPQTFENITLSNQIKGLTGKYNFSMMNFIIPLKSKKQTEALQFALFLTNEKNQLELAKQTNILATNKYALSNDFYTKSNNNDLFTQARILSAKQLKNLQPQPFYKDRKEIITLINNATQKILLEQDTIENVLTKLKEDWENLK